MHDIKFIRNNPDVFDAKLASRNITPNASELLELDTEFRHVTTSLNELQSRKNAISKEIGMNKNNKELVEKLTAESTECDYIIDEYWVRQRGAERQLHDALALIPNLPADDVPVGNTSDENVEIHRTGTPREFSFTPKDHTEIGQILGSMDFDVAAKMSGSRFVVLKNNLAKLERAIAQFMLDFHTSEEGGYTEINPPLLVGPNALYNTGQLPKFGDDMFKTKDDRWLIPTAEVPLTNIVADKILQEDAFPLRFVAYTPCFRSEAGSAGLDTKGMIRQHQFYKVELVSIVKPENSNIELERMTLRAEMILEKLDLPYKRMLLCTGDMGFAAQKTYDLEVWIPSQNKYREISSCSNCGDFQARRMQARYYNDKKKTVFVHTLNGSGKTIIGRTLVAILENYQNEDGSVTVPEVLIPYMNGIKLIKF